MRDEVQHIMEDLEFLFPGEEYSGHRTKIRDAFKPAIVRYQYYEMLAARPGQSEQIKRELSTEHDISVSGVDKYISRIN